MYLIIRHDFDSLENSLPAANSSSIIGYIEEEKEADIWIASQNNRKYKGWDNIMYPYYTKKLIKHIEL